MNRLLLTFANPFGSEPLPTLREEDEGITRVLSRRDSLHHFVVTKEQYATISKVSEALEKYKNDLCVFLYSGHAGHDRLFLQDGEANAKGLAMLLGQCANRGLKVVILNGCSTGGQVEVLLDSGVPVVVATSAPVNDLAATRFSIAFFSALAEEGLPLLEAFRAGARAAQVINRADIGIDLQVRSAGFSDGNEETGTWGIFCKSENRLIAETWKLPEPSESDCQCNLHLLKSLPAVFNRYLKHLGHHPNEWGRQALEHLPFPVSEPLRKLLASKARSQESGIFYDTATWSRFRMLMYTWKSLVNLLAFSLLADLWETKEKRNENVAIPEDLFPLLQKTMLSGDLDERNSSFLPILFSLVKVFEKNGISPFLSELPAAVQNLQTNETLRVAVADLEDKLARGEEVRRENATPALLCDLCNKTEESVGRIVFNFGFLVQYAMTSIKDIGVEKTRHKPEAAFLHSVVKLQISWLDREDERLPSESFLENASVILHRQSEWRKDVLNLSPFYMDKHALFHAPKASLHSLVSFVPQGGALCFRQISRIEDIWVLRPPARDVDDDFYGMETSEEDKIQEAQYLLVLEQLQSMVAKLFNKTI